MNEVSLKIQEYLPYRNMKDVIESKDDQEMNWFISNCEDSVNKIDKTVEELESFIVKLKEEKVRIQDEKEQVIVAADTVDRVEFFFQPTVKVRNVDKYLNNYSSRSKKVVVVSVEQVNMKKVFFKDGSEAIKRGDRKYDFIVKEVREDWVNRKLVNDVAKEWAKEYDCEIQKVKY